jgi:hypothetical protein
MTNRPQTTSSARRRARPLAALTGAVVLLLTGAVTAVAASPPARISSRHSDSARRGASPYPAGATRQAFAVRPSEFAKAAARAKAPSKRKRSRGRHAATVLRGDPARALVAFQAMQSSYYIPGSGLYAGEPFSYLWPFASALSATITLAEIPQLAKTMAHEVQTRLVGLQSYYDPNNSGAAEGTFTSTLPAYDGTVAPPAGPGGPKYYDDNDWIGIELMRLYKITRTPSLLSEAESIMAFEMAGWQANPALVCPGGIPFSNTPENTQRNTVTTAPAAELGVQLYRMTGNSSYLAFAEMAYEWVRHCLQQPNFLYADHIDPQGVVEPTLWSYNQGTMIGAGALLYQETGNQAYLIQARQTAQAAMAYFTPSVLELENPFFPAVYFRNLLYLDEVTHETSAHAVAQNYVNYAWESERLTDDIFVGGSPATAQLLVQASISQIYGLLSTPAYTFF